MQNATTNEIIFPVGPSGCGKNHILSLMSEHLVFHDDGCSKMLYRLTGDFELSEADKKRMKNGKRVSDDVIIPRICHVVRDITEPLTFIDGYCRSESQVDSLLMEPFNRFKIGIIYIETPLDVCYDRLIKRGRPDDTPEAVERKLEDFRRFMRPAMLSAVERHGGLIVDGLNPNESIGRIINEFNLYTYLKEGSVYEPTEDMLGIQSVQK